MRRCHACLPAAHSNSSGIPEIDAVYNTHTVHSTQFTIQNMHRTAHYLHKNERRRFDMDTAARDADALHDSYALYQDTIRTYHHPTKTHDSFF